MSKNKPIIVLAALLTLASSPAANALNLNGLGTRAQAMGGAFVGLADDFSAVFWNPGGAAGFRKETFGFYAADLVPRSTYLLESAIPEAPYVDARTKRSHYLAFLGAYYQPVGLMVVVGLGFGTPSGLGAKAIEEIDQRKVWRNQLDGTPEIQSNFVKFAKYDYRSVRLSPQWSDVTSPDDTYPVKNPGLTGLIVSRTYSQVVSCEKS